MNYYKLNEIKLKYLNILSDNQSKNKNELIKIILKKYNQDELNKIYYINNFDFYYIDYKLYYTLKSSNILKGEKLFKMILDKCFKTNYKDFYKFNYDLNYNLNILELKKILINNYKINNFIKILFNHEFI